jgi:hypothetical protein
MNPTLAQTVYNATNLKAIRMRIKRDVRALVKLHQHRSGLSLYRTGKLDNPFEIDLCTTLKKGGFELLQAAEKERAEGSISAAGALAIFNDTFRFLEKQWESPGFLVRDILPMMGGRGAMSELRESLVTEMNRLRPPRKNFRPNEPETLRKPPPEFPNRVAWLKLELRKRGWSKYDISQQGGPDHKTVQKILDGAAVRPGVLKGLARALTEDKKFPAVDLLVIPRD